MPAHFLTKSRAGNPDERLSGFLVTDKVTIPPAISSTKTASPGFRPRDWRVEDEGTLESEFMSSDYDPRVAGLPRKPTSRSLLQLEPRLSTPGRWRAGLASGRVGSMREFAGGWESAFPEMGAWLGQALHAAELDHAAFLRPLRRCSLDRCAGTCCHDGVSLNADEAAWIRDWLVEGESTMVERSTEALVPKTDGSGWKTAVQPRTMRARAEAYPVHFPETACVFLDEAARCRLQLWSEAAGRHPWFAKPFTCWMHPIALEAGPPPVLTIHTASNDPQAAEGYPGFASSTHCGRLCEDRSLAEPAYRVLERELSLLGRLGGRRFLEELERFGGSCGDSLDETGAGEVGSPA